MKIFRLILFLMLLRISAFAAPQTYYVAKTGSDANSCAQAKTISTPKLTIAAGIACMAAPGANSTGDYVIVRSGTYTENLDSGSITFPTGNSWFQAGTISAYTTETVTLNGNGNGIINMGSGASYLIFNKFVIDGSNGSSGSNGIVIDGHHIRIQNCEIKNVNGSAILINNGTGANEIIYNNIHKWAVTTSPDGGFHGVEIKGPSNVVANNEIHCDDGVATMGSGVFAYNSGSSTAVHDNIVRTNNIHGCSGSASNQAGILLSSGSANIAYNNLVIANKFGVRTDSACVNCLVYNNTIYNNTSVGIRVGLDTGATNTGNELKNNISYNNGTAITDSGSGTVQATNLTTDPTFVNAGTGDYRIQTGSAAKDTGTTLATVTKDYMGALRPQGAGYDIGAYEFRSNYDYVVPALPETFSTTYSLPGGGTTWHVHNGDNLQTTLDAAALGDVIILDAGAIFSGNFKLPIKSGTDWLYIISSELASLPEGVRVSPSDVSHMPTLKAISSTNRPILATFKSAHHYRFAGIHFDNSTNISTVDSVRTGYGSGLYSDPSYTWTSVTNDSDLPSHITLDRCLIDTTNVKPIATRIGANFSGKYMAVIDSYIYGIADSADSQAVLVWNGGGPYKIVNNYLEATGENFMSGGTTPAIAGAIPHDIDFENNYLNKQTSTYSLWTIKNSFELKNATRVLVKGNLMENVGKDDQGQGATPIVITPRNDNGGVLPTAISDVTIQYNRIHNVGKAWRNSSTDDVGGVTRESERILIENNATDGQGAFPGSVGTIPTSGGQSSGNGYGHTTDLTVRNNLFLPLDGQSYANSYFITAPLGLLANRNLVYENNIVAHGNFGFFGNTVGTGIIALNTFTRGYTFRRNVFINRANDTSYAFWKAGSNFSNAYTADNSLADLIPAVGFTDYANSDYSLTIGSTYHNYGSDGADPGPNWTNLSVFAVNARNGFSPSPDSITVSDMPNIVLPDRHYTVTFTAVGITGLVKAEVSRDGGSNYTETITSGQLYSEGNIDWLVAAGTPSSNCKVKVTSLDDPLVFAETSVFRIGGTRAFVSR